MRKSALRICRFIVSNFKSIGEPGIDLELKPLTLLFGPQGAGKSNILEAFWRFARLLYETVVRSSYGEMQYLAHIEPRYSNLKSIFHKEDPHRLLKIGTFVPIEEGKIGGWVIGFREEFKENELVAFEEVVLNGEVVLKLGRIAKGQGTHQLIVLTPERLRHLSVVSKRWPPATRPEVFELANVPEELIKSSRHARYIASAIVKSLVGKRVTKVAFLTALRGQIHEEVSTDEYVEDDGEVYPLKPDGSNLIPYLSFILNSSRYMKYADFMRRWAKELGLDNLMAGFWGRHRLSADFRDNILNVAVKLAHASHGARQALCVIAQLFSPTQEIILIEEPEISLHPESVVKLPLMFLDAIEMGKQIIITTHSTILPLALSKMVKEARERGLCEDPNELIAVYEIWKDEEGTKAERYLLDERGYIKGYVKSFWIVEEELLKEWEEKLPEVPT